MFYLKYPIFAGRRKKQAVSNHMPEPEIDPDLKEDFEWFMKFHGLGSVWDILAIPPEKLLKMEGFGMRMMMEVMRLKTLKS
jgi:hypothetical protein